MMSLLPALTEVGEIDRIEGAGLLAGLIVNSAEPEFPPPGVGFVTLRVAVPEFAMSAAVICTCNCVLEVFVVVRALPFH
jgi:hypothetical protein